MHGKSRLTKLMAMIDRHLESLTHTCRVVIQFDGFLCTWYPILKSDNNRKEGFMFSALVVLRGSVSTYSS